jgi:hypothetical protein
VLANKRELPEGPDADRIGRLSPQTQREIEAGSLETLCFPTALGVDARARRGSEATREPSSSKDVRG